MTLFSKLVSSPKSKKGKATKQEMRRTTAFVESLNAESYRLSYTALAKAASQLGEDSSTQIPAQRGAALTLLLPDHLQPLVCRRNGGYSEAATAAWKVEIPADLRERGIIRHEQVKEAVEAFEASEAEAETEA